MDWINLLAARLRANLGHLLESERERIVSEELSKAEAATLAGRPFGEEPRPGDHDFTGAVPRRARADEPKAEESRKRPKRVDRYAKEREKALTVQEALAKAAQDADPLTSRGERLSALRARAHREWEDWL